ncbi:hypothetical protein LCGC14_1904580 [marine sediment metagenome]|uniref:Uncharacterized protein n=1 Tax=marine sediment metagenome TaxID=412755 RepID=A0A0F9GIU9_9ZZZZ
MKSLLSTEIAVAERRLENLKKENLRGKQEATVDVMSKRISGGCGPEIYFGGVSDADWWKAACEIACDRIWELEHA